MAGLLRQLNFSESEMNVKFTFYIFHRLNPIQNQHLRWWFYKLNSLPCKYIFVIFLLEKEDNSNSCYAVTCIVPWMIQRMVQQFKFKYLPLSFHSENMQYYFMKCNSNFQRLIASRRKQFSAISSNYDLLFVHFYCVNLSGLNSLLF